MNQIKFLVFGFLVKIVTGLDDTATNIPVIASLTRTRMGKIAFTIGMLSAIITAIIIATTFSWVIKAIPYYRYITAGLILFLAAGIYFDLFIHKPKAEAEKKLPIKKRISAGRFTQLMIIGFIGSFATVFDDIIAYLPLFTADSMELWPYSVAGIIIATLCEIVLIIFFSEKIAKIPYKEEIAAAGLVILAGLILFEVI
jgi:hypothetical protein